ARNSSLTRSAGPSLILAADPPPHVPPSPSTFYPSRDGAEDAGSRYRHKRSARRTRAAAGSGRSRRLKKTRRNRSRAPRKQNQTSVGELERRQVHLRLRREVRIREPADQRAVRVLRFVPRLDVGLT